MQAQGIDGYVIAFFDPKVDRTKMDASISAFPLVIHLPMSLIERMRGEDSKRLEELMRDVRRAISPQAPSLPSAPSNER